MGYGQLTQLIQDCLGLHRPPIALARLERRPPRIPVAQFIEATAAQLWQLAEQELIYVSSIQHLASPVDALVMGFSLPVEHQQGLMKDLQVMSRSGYLRSGEVPRIPQFQSPAQGILYGPLHSFPVKPQVALLHLNVAQLAVMQEVIEIEIFSSVGGERRVGWPVSGILPSAHLSGKGYVSFHQPLKQRIPCAIPILLFDRVEKHLPAAIRSRAQLRTDADLEKPQFLTL